MTLQDIFNNKSQWIGKKAYSNYTTAGETPVGESIVDITYDDNGLLLLHLENGERFGGTKDLAHATAIKDGFSLSITFCGSIRVYG